MTEERFLPRDTSAYVLAHPDLWDIASLLVPGAEVKGWASGPWSDGGRLHWSRDKSYELSVNMQAVTRATDLNRCPDCSRLLWSSITHYHWRIPPMAHPQKPKHNGPFPPAPQVVLDTPDLWDLDQVYGDCHVTSEGEYGRRTYKLVRTVGTTTSVLTQSSDALRCHFPVCNRLIWQNMPHKYCLGVDDNAPTHS